MTKHQESGENDITLKAKKEGIRTKRDLAAILAEMFATAKKEKDKKALGKIIKAQKYLQLRNKRKRKG